MHPGEILWTVAIGVAVVATVGYGLSIYNGLVSLKNNIGRSWANIDVLLKQRHDELPKLVKTCEGYMQHERAVFDRLSEARGALARARTIEQRADAESELSRSLSGFFAVAESYPDLKANRNYLELQSQLEGTENRIAQERQRFNTAVQAYNTAIKLFPTSVIAKLFGFEPKNFFQSDPGAEKAPQVKF